MAQNHRPTHRHGDSMTESAQWGYLVNFIYKEYLCSASVVWQFKKLFWLTPVWIYLMSGIINDIEFKSA